MSINYVSPEVYDAIIAKRDEAQKFRTKLKRPNLTLAQKIELQRKAKAAEAEMHRLAETGGGKSQ
jgi:hypothetical protein